MVKRNPYIIEDVIKEYERGNSPANLAIKWGVHPTTIRRWLKKAGKAKQLFPTLNDIDDETKHLLRKLLIKYNVENVDAVMKAIINDFYVEVRGDKQDEDFPIIILD